MRDALDMVKLGEFGARMPAQLSGGQQQRVALARALAPKPRVLLLDEPLSALDLKLRKQMQSELKRLQGETGIAFVLVTHDQEEALAMSDRIAVMRDGNILQVDGPRDIYDNPATTFVADFIGELNLLPGAAIGRHPNSHSVGPSRECLCHSQLRRPHRHAGDSHLSRPRYRLRRNAQGRYAHPFAKPRRQLRPQGRRRGDRQLAAERRTRARHMSEAGAMKRSSALLLIGPTVLIIGVFMVLPLVIAVAYSFLTAGPYGGVQQPPTLDAYIQLLFQRDFDDTLVFSPSYIWIVIRSIWIALATTIVCLALGLPVAWYIVCQTPERRRTLLFLVTLPFWINTLIRTYCWILILRDEGLANNLLRTMGAISQPLPLLYNDGAILLGHDLHVPALHGAADLLDARAHRSAPDRGGLRSLCQSLGRGATRDLATGQAGRARRRQLGVRPGSGLVPRAGPAGRRQEAADRQPDPDAVHLVAQLALRRCSRDGGDSRDPHRVRPAGAPDRASAAMSTARGFDWRYTPGLLPLTIAIMAFLYAPLLILVVYAFNANRLVTVWTGISLDWFVHVAGNDDIRKAALNSIIIAVAAAIASTAIATAGAIALQRGRLGLLGGLAGGHDRPAADRAGDRRRHHHADLFFGAGHAQRAVEPDHRSHGVLHPVCADPDPGPAE